MNKIITCSDENFPLTLSAGPNGRVRPKADETTEKEMVPVYGGAMGVMSYVRRTIFTFHMPAV